MNILTIDLEDWFHILDHREVASTSSWDRMESRIEKNTDRILDLLEAKNIKATWFCLGWVVKKYPSLIKKIAEKHELACHSVDHKLLYLQKREEVKEDIRINMQKLEDLTGKKMVAYRAPGFSFTPETKWLVNVLAELGILYDCSVFPAKRNHGGYKGFPSSGPCRINYEGNEIKEFPLNTELFAGRHFVFSGGGYFRLLPVELILELMKKSSYVMTYFHPRDFDPDQPVMKSLSLKRKFMSYVGLKKSFSKLNRLLNEHKFIPVGEAAMNINWNETPLINLDNY